MQVEFIDLRIFVAVADTGSITAGADRVALSLAATSARVRALELQVGAALFERGRRRDADRCRPGPAAARTGAGTAGTGHAQRAW